MSREEAINIEMSQMESDVVEVKKENEMEIEEKKKCICREKDKSCEECYTVRYSIACYGIDDPVAE